MAEALLKRICGDVYDIYSRWTPPRVVRPGGGQIEAMAEIGIDISSNRSKSVEEFMDREIDVVLTVCDSARDECPVFPSASLIHRAIPDPVYATGDDAARREAFRQARDEIRDYLVNEFLPK